MLSLFKGHGIELEYMIVDDKTLNILPITDKVMHAITGRYADEVERGEISWSNELALHVIEFKTTGPMPSLDNLSNTFQKHVHEVNAILKQFNGRLMPTAMHPWMDPFQETKLWPHDHNPVYESYHRIFDCRGHGWSNLQSSHINLPFANDAEFAKLHAAIRVLLPIMPALAASSPIVEKKLTGFADTRLDVYMTNARVIPSITGKGIPEVAHSKNHYEQTILNPMYKDIAPLDTENILQYEWLNSRGAIARFDRNTIEIRVLDVQECPMADLAIAHLIVEALKALVNEEWLTIDQLNQIHLETLYQLFLCCIKKGETCIITDTDFLKAFGITEKKVTAQQIWQHLKKKLRPTPYDKALNIILNRGTLSSRIQNRFKEENLHSIYQKLCDCLEKGEMFV